MYFMVFLERKSHFYGRRSTEDFLANFYGQIFAFYSYRKWPPISPTKGHVRPWCNHICTSTAWGTDYYK